MVTFQESYEVPFRYRKYFTPEECVSLSKAFKNYDKDKSGSIDSPEFKHAIKETGYIEADDAKIADCFKKFDKNNDGSIDWHEFIEMSISL